MNYFNFFKKYLSIILLMIYFNSYSQVIPLGFLFKNIPNTIFADAAFDLSINERSYWSDVQPHIFSDFKFKFNQNTPYSIQFIVKNRDINLNVGLFTYGPILKFDKIANNPDKPYDSRSQFLSFYIYNGNIYKTSLANLNRYKLSPTENIINGQVYQISSTYDGTTQREYINGILVNTHLRTVSTFETDSLNLILGLSDDNTNVILDEVRFWDKALTANEIANNWNKNISGDEEGLQLYYNFNDQVYPNKDNTNIGVIKDKSINNNNGHIIACDLSGTNQNFVSNMFTFIANVNSPIFSFDANNYDSYPGSGNNNNPSSLGKVYNLNGFNNNLQFYSNSINNFTNPVLSTNGGRSFSIQNMYAKTNLNSNIIGNNSVSIEVWVNFLSNYPFSVVTIGDNSSKNKFELVKYSNKILINIGEDKHFISNNDIDVNKWYHVVCIYDNFVYKIYINGILDKQENVSIQQNTSNTQLFINKTLYSGVIQYPGQFNIGILNLYNRNLNESEISNKYKATKARFGY